MIEDRREIPPKQFEPDYLDEHWPDHRKAVGGRWDEMGALQRDFLLAHGLQPHHRVLDVGCGSLRAGRVFVDVLDPGHYYGIDANHGLIDAGYRLELADTQRARLPEGNLRATDRFDVDFGVTFDMVIANSVFTHISLNYIRVCLHRVAKVMAPGGRFFASYFMAPPDAPLDTVAGAGRWHERNPYWYYRTDLLWAASRLPWRFENIGAWGHPAGQRMVCYHRLDEVRSPVLTAGAEHVGSS